MSMDFRCRNFTTCPRQANLSEKFGTRQDHTCLVLELSSAGKEVLQEKKGVAIQLLFYVFEI